MHGKRIAPHVTTAERLLKIEHAAQREAQLAELRKLYPVERIYANAEFTSRGRLK